MSSLVIAAVTIIGTLGFMIFMRKRLGAQYGHMKAGVVAPRLGMQLVEGNPEHNLAIQSVLPSVQNTGSAGGFLKQMAATSVGGTLGEFRMQMVGKPYGLDAELRLYVREDLEVGYSSNTTTTWSDLRLTVAARCNVAPFDLRLRKEMTGLETRRECNDPRMPVQRFNVPALDERFVIESYDPQVATAIAQALGPIAHTLVYTHVVGAKNQISFVMTPASIMCSALSFEQILHALASIAAVFEGRAIPQPMAA